MTPFAQALTQALLHFIWQGIAIGVLLYVALILLRKRSARSRYAASCLALAALAALPPVTAWIAYSHSVSSAPARTNSVRGIAITTTQSALPAKSL